MKLKHFIIAIAIIILDQISKLIMIDKYITVIPSFLEFNYTENTGGAFGVGKINFILVISILIIIGLIVLLIKESKNKSEYITSYIPMILILSGSISNLFDRLLRGFVVDFIDVNIFNFPNFNVADIAIVIGVFLLIIMLIKQIVLSTKKDEKEGKDKE